jgi:hypothetical protein
MSHTITPQHPAVVLRSHYVHLRSLLAIAMIAVVGLTVAVVILATNNGGRTSKSSSMPVTASAQLAPGVRFDGGPEEGTRGPLAQPHSPSTRFDGGPEEGTRGPGQ